MITELMCNGVVDLDAVGNRFGLNAWDYFAAEIVSLHAPEGLCDEGLVELDGSRIRATELGRLFVRRLALEFDAHSARRTGHAPAFSRTI